MHPRAKTATRSSPQKQEVRIAVDMLSPEQEFQVRSAEFALQKVDKKEVERLYLELLRLHLGHQNTVKILLHQEISGQIIEIKKTMDDRNG